MSWYWTRLDSRECTHRKLPSTCFALLFIYSVLGRQIQGFNLRNWLTNLLWWNSRMHFVNGCRKSDANTTKINGIAAYACVGKWRVRPGLLITWNWYIYHAYQSLACETAINTDFSELFSLKRIYVKYKNAILSIINCFFRTWKG